MDRVTVMKIAFALAGVALFAYGVRSDDPIFRWVGIGCVIAAFLLRFVKKRIPDEDDDRD
jgi:hypothetical protein